MKQLLVLMMDLRMVTELDLSKEKELDYWMVIEMD